jgi:uncharacterized pyridoxal phosphate-containing UPF0001 family protein
MNHIVDEEFPLVSSYLSFFSQPEIQEFLNCGGKVFAATEGRSVQQIRMLLEAGHIHFAEKYLQEAETKYPSLKIEYPNLHLNYFGKLQTNKIPRIVQLFDTVESVSRTGEVDCIKKEMQKKPIKATEFFVQWNIGNEPQKNGVSENQLAYLLDYCSAKEFPITGLMIIPPKFDDPRAYFTKARSVADKFGIEKCQMGFSEDYKIAIESGSNQIRIGRLFFDNYL